MRRTPAPLLLLGGLLALYLAAPFVAGLGRLGEADWRGADVSAIAHATAVSLGSATAATLLVTLCGVPLGYALARSRGRLAAAVGLLVQMPLALPPLASGVLLLFLLGYDSPLGRLAEGGGLGRLTDSFAGIVLAEAFVAAPFLVIAARSAFAAVDPQLEAMAATLGHPPGAVFRRVALPVAARAVLAGALLAWLRAFGEFGATVLVAYHPYSLPVLTFVAFGSEGLPATLPLLLPTLAASAAVLLASRRAAAPSRAAAPGRRPAARGAVGRLGPAGRGGGVRPRRPGGGGGGRGARTVGRRHAPRGAVRRGGALPDRHGGADGTRGGSGARGDAGTGARTGGRRLARRGALRHGGVLPDRHGGVAGAHGDTARPTPPGPTAGGTASPARPASRGVGHPAGEAAGGDDPDAATLRLALRRRLPGFSLDVCWAPRSRRLAVLGASGSGKSSTLRAIAGLDRAPGDVVTLDGRALGGLPPHRRGAALVPQDYALLPHLTVARQLRFAAGADAALARRWTGRLGSRSWRGGCRTRSRSGSGSAWRWGARWPVPPPRCCCWTSRSPRWTPPCAAASAGRCASCRRRRGCSPCWSRTTPARPRCSPTSCCCCATARCWAAARCPPCSPAPAARPPPACSAPS